MAVLIEAFNVIINDDAFSEQSEKRQLFLESIPTKAFCSDGLLYRVGFMESHYAYEYIDYLQKEIGIRYLDENKNSIDIVLVNMLTGATTECDWFKFKRAKHFSDLKEYSNSEEDFSIGWRIDSFQGIPENYLIFNSSDNEDYQQFYFEGLSTPFGWNPDRAIYSSDYIGKPDEELIKIDENNDVSTYLNKATGEKTYVGTPSSSTYDLLEYSEEFQESIGGSLIRDKDGFLKLFGYRGNGLFNGDIFNIEELTKFAINIIGSEYQKEGTILTDLNYEINDKPNFIIKSHKDISVYVRISDKIDGKTNFEKLKNKNSKTPYNRLAIISFWEFNNSSRDWEKVIIGENGSKDGFLPFIVNFELKTLDEIIVSTPLSEELSHNELLLKFAKTWETLDVTIITPYLEDNFNYFSDWVFDYLPSKTEYIEYLEGKFKAIKDTNHKYEFNIVENDEGKYAILFDQNGEKALFTIKVKNGKILKSKMSALNLKQGTPNNHVNYVPHSLLENEEVESKVKKNKISWFKKLFGK